MEDKMTEPHAERSGLSLLNGIAALFSDYSDLVQKEIRLARAEIVEAVTSQLRSGALMAAAGFLGLVAFLLIIEGIVFWSLSSCWPGPADFISTPDRRQRTVLSSAEALSRSGETFVP
jgi:putative superfamily III holin-X